jgi:hypothetical protein
MKRSFFFSGTYLLDHRKCSDTGAIESPELVNLFERKLPSPVQPRMVKRRAKCRCPKAEHRANYAMCSTGQYPALCRHEDLTPDERKTVSAAEHRTNLQMCLLGTYPALCRHQDLSLDEAKRVSAVEGRPTQRFFSILLGESVALGEDACHFRHVLASARLRPSGVSA